MSAWEVSQGGSFFAMFWGAEKFSQTLCWDLTYANSDQSPGSTDNMFKDTNGASADPSNAKCFCGNGKLESGERCDDGNTLAGDGCGVTCQIECGNTYLDSGETCDDGNTVAGDGCSATCQIECGNEVVDVGEECDDSNTDGGDGCSATCQMECGNGVVDSGETCDDGNTVAGDGCSATCQKEPEIILSIPQSSEVANQDAAGQLSDTLQL
jgi:cysteine-rich repeat protein